MASGGELAAEQHADFRRCSFASRGGELRMSGLIRCGG